MLAMSLKHVLLITAVSITSLAQALESDTRQEITIQSDRAEFDRKNGTATYIGNVLMRQGTLKIDADQVTLFSNEEQKLEKAIATGKPARFQQQMESDKGLTKARGNNITYLTTEKTITIKQEANLEQEGNQFSGEKIVYDITNDSVAASGGTQTQTTPEEPQPRVIMIIQPANDQDSDATSDQPQTPAENNNEDA